MLRTSLAHQQGIHQMLHKAIMISIWVIAVCYFNASNDKQSQTPQYTYFAHYIIYSKVVPIYYMFRLD
jgi:hypothetical protein